MITERLLKLTMELVNAGIGMELKKTPEGLIGAFPTSGFYKSQGSAYLVDRGGDHRVLRQRYGEECPVQTIEEIVFKSYYWLEVTRERNSGYIVTKDLHWAGLYDQFELEPL